MPTDLSYREIPLTRGKIAIVDAADYERLNQFKWYAQCHFHTCQFYARRNIRKSEGKRGTIWMHREILGLIAGDGLLVDHKDIHATLDNRRSNLRIATKAQNSMNRSFQSNNICGLKGVSPHGNGYMARIVIRGKSLYIGRRKTAEEAHALYVERAKEAFGEFARAV